MKNLDFAQKPFYILIHKNMNMEKGINMSYEHLFNDRAVKQYIEAKGLTTQQVETALEKNVQRKVKEAIGTPDSYVFRPLLNAVKYTTHGLSPVSGFKNYFDDLASDLRDQEQENFRITAYNWVVEEFEDMQQHYNCAPKPEK